MWKIKKFLAGKVLNSKKNPLFLKQVIHNPHIPFAENPKMKIKCFQNKNMEI